MACAWAVDNEHSNQILHENEGVPFIMCKQPDTVEGMQLASSAESSDILDACI